MSFDLAAFKAKIAKINAALPAIGQLVLTAQVLAPKAAGLTKAGLVINTIIAAEPALAECGQMLQAAVTGVVDAYRSDGTLPPKGSPIDPATQGGVSTPAVPPQPTPGGGQ